MITETIMNEKVRLKTRLILACNPLRKNKFFFDKNELEIKKDRFASNKPIVMFGVSVIEIADEKTNKISMAALRIHKSTKRSSDNNSFSLVSIIPSLEIINIK